MRITLLGTGTPILDPERQGPAVLISVDKQHLLFDTGRNVLLQLVRAGIAIQSVNAVFITHHHADHIADLGDVILAAWKSGREKPLQIFGPAGTAEIVTALLDGVYKRPIEFTLALEARLGYQMASIRDLIKVTDVKPGLVYAAGTLKVRAAYVVHGHTALNLSYEEWPCLGYRIEAEENSVAVSGDTIACEGLYRLSEKANVLVQACYLAEAEITNPDFEFLAQYTIASSGQVGKIAAQADVKKLVLTHVRKKSEEMLHTLLDDVRHDYAGEIVLAEDLMVIDI